MTLLADAYLDRIDFLKYLPQTDCAACGAKTCRGFVEDLKRGEKKLADCPEIPENRYYSFEIALDADNLLPEFPCLTAPRPGPTGLIEINTPSADSPILISGNNIHTQDVLTSILSTTRSPFFLLFTDSKGHTVDMALIYESMMAEQISKDVRNSGVLTRTSHQEITIPGLAAAVGNELRQSTRWDVIVGPICAAELPLFFGDRWLPSRH
jgi:acetyl-CoA decarbonylase/synthase complex subunit gamma